MELNERELTDFINKFRDRVFRTCLGFVQDTDDASDLTQEVFLAVIESLHTYRSESKLETWMYRIAVNKSLNFLRKRKMKAMFRNIDNLVFGREKKEIPQASYNPGEMRENSEEARFLLAHALRKLPNNQRIAFTLSKYDEMSNERIAHIMDVSLSAVESLQHRAKRNMQNTIRTFTKIKFTENE
ncbi:MAG: RNA polymerase sigma factor [Bacteroidales bacterium]|jgi:RNA polymerase sigma-70 factor (ECF subfamily)